MLIQEVAYYRYDGSPVFLKDLAREILVKAPETRGKHIFVQLQAIDRIEEFRRASTPYSLPYTFVE